ncbi:MAG: hypothetical protein A3F40_04545 [Chlamydiae bacterium RIFCSPHIGHO2_12_FULL_27_8]|nr:MAG: hypothetical protein A3F40_04545 [Chlamydiae bacterium RIFCSPHIGHO2_12_FULL_27_8]
MKRYKIHIIIFLVIFFTNWGIIFFNKKKIAGTYLKYLSNYNLFIKSKEKKRWIDERFLKDTKDFEGKKISIEAIDQTYNLINQNLPSEKENFIRFRIVNNNLYRYVPKGEILSKREIPFEKALRTLSKIRKLPDLDIIYSDQDGTPLKGINKNFYITQNKDNQAPIFSRAKLKNAPYIILIPDYHSLSKDWYDDLKKFKIENKKSLWEKKKNIAFWRGALHTDERTKLCDISLDYKNHLDAGLGTEHSIKKEHEKFFRGYIKREDQLNYKYLPVLDGIMCTYNGYQWRLLSNSVVFKQESDEEQWFYDLLKPYTHYIPIKRDMSDLIDRIDFARENDSKCKEISENATKFIIENLTFEDVYLYLFKTLENYSKILEFSDSFKRDTIKELEWVNIQYRRKANKKFKKYEK